MKMITVEIFFKSGNKLVLKCEKLKLKYSGEMVTSMTWENEKGHLMFIDLTQVECVYRK